MIHWRPDEQNKGHFYVDTVKAHAPQDQRGKRSTGRRGPRRGPRQELQIHRHRRSRRHAGHGEADGARSGQHSDRKAHGGIRPGERRLEGSRHPLRALRFFSVTGPIIRGRRSTSGTGRRRHQAAPFALSRARRRLGTSQDGNPVPAVKFPVERRVKSLTLRPFLGIVKRFARTSLFVCLHWGWLRIAGAEEQAREVRGQIEGRSAGPVPESSPLAEGRNKRTIPLGQVGADRRMVRYGARAFSTLEGYASRNRETELAPGFEDGTTATVPVLV